MCGPRRVPAEKPVLWLVCHLEENPPDVIPRDRYDGKNLIPYVLVVKYRIGFYTGKI